MGNLCLSVNPPQAGMEALPKKKLNLHTQNFPSVLVARSTCLTHHHDIRVLRVPVVVGTKIMPVYEKSCGFWEALEQLP